MSNNNDDFENLDGDVPLDKLKGVAGGTNKQKKVGIDEEASASTHGSAGDASADVSVKADTYSSGDGQASATVGLDINADAQASTEGKYGSASAEAHAEVLDGATGEVHSDHEDTGFSGKAGTAVEGDASAQAQLGDDKTNIRVGADGDVVAGTEASADGDIYHGDGHYGASGSFGAFDDAGVDGEVTGGGDVDGYGGQATIGGSVGDTGIGGSFDAEYQDHELTIGGSGSLGLEIAGVDVGFQVDINTKPFEDAANDTANWTSGAVNTVGDDMSNAGDDLKHGDVGGAISDAFKGW